MYAASAGVERFPRYVADWGGTLWHRHMEMGSRPGLPGSLVVAWTGGTSRVCPPGTGRTRQRDQAVSDERVRGASGRMESAIELCLRGCRCARGHELCPCACRRLVVRICVEWRHMDGRSGNLHLYEGSGTARSVPLLFRPQYSGCGRTVSIPVQR